MYLIITKQIQILLIGFFSFVIAVGIVTCSEATFPSKSIAHWKPSISEEVSDPIYIRIHELVRKKKYEEALKILESKTRQSSDKATAFILKGILLNEIGDPIKGLIFVRKGHLIEARHPAIQFGFCQIYRNLGNAVLTERACTITIQQHSDSPEAHYEFAQTLMALGKMKEAGKALDRAIEFDPDNFQYYYERGLIYSYLNDNLGAEQFFLKSLSKNPDDYDSAYQLAYLYAVQNKIDLSRKYIDQVLKTDEPNPKMSSARNLADYINKHSLDRLPHKIDPAKYHQSRSKALYRSKQFGLSLLEIQTAVKLKPADPRLLEILLGLSSILLRIDRAEAAANQFIEAAGENKTLRARGFQKLGDIKVVLGKLDEAKENYQKAIALGDPNQLAKISLKEIPKNGSKSPFNRNELYIDPVEGLNRTGEIFANYKMFKSALGFYSASLKLHPKHLMTMLNIGALHYQSENYIRAINTLEKILVQNPQHNHIEGHRLLMAQAYTKKGDYPTAVQNLKILFQMNPGYKKVVQTDPVFEPLHIRQDYKNLFP